MTADAPVVVPYKSGGNGKRSINYILQRNAGVVDTGDVDNALTRWAVDRITNPISYQDLVIAVQGKRGSGKSVTAVYLAWKLSKAMARRFPGTKPEDYFTIDNVCALEDTPRMLEIMGRQLTNQIYILDDASVGLNSRNFSQVSSKNAVAMFTTMRNRRNIVILTLPLLKNADLQIREYVDINFIVFLSKHAAKVNILKCTSQTIGAQGGVYNKRLVFDGKKVDFYVARLPPDDMLKAYSIARDKSSNEMAKRIIETGTYRTDKHKEAGVKKAEIETKLQSNNDTVIELTKKGISQRKICEHLGISRYLVDKILTRAKQNGGL